MCTTSPISAHNTRGTRYDVLFRFFACLRHAHLWSRNTKYVEFKRLKAKNRDKYQNNFGWLRTTCINSRTVEWPRYTERERRDRCWLGGQLLFFWGDFSCCIKPQMRGRNGGRLQSELMGGLLKEIKAPCPSRHFSARRVNTRITYS